MAHHILVVDDEPITCKLLRMLLESAGHRVGTEGDGRAALNYMTKEQPELVILDLMMPIMDGFEVLENAKAYPPIAAIPIVVLTASQNAEYKEQALKLGAALCLSKPFAKESVFEAIHQLLDRD